MDAVIKRKAGRVAAGKHRTRPVEVHMRTVPILTEGQRERVREALAGAAIAGCVALTGLVEGSTWPM